MSQPAQHRPIGIEEYLTDEQGAQIRHEFIGGRVYAMVGASDRHNLVAGNVFVALHQHLRASPCQVFMSDMKVRIRVGSDDIFYYPDVVVSCAQDDREPYFRTQPRLIVEVLSDATERIDRQEKLLAYTRLGSLETYVLLAQDLAEATLYRRSADWTAVQVAAEGILSLDCVGLDLPMTSVYEGVDLARRA